MVREQLSNPQERAALAAQLNDEFRRTTPEMYTTPGIRALPDMPWLLQEVRHYNNFTPENDAHGEHDSGSIEWKGSNTLWKIDYYDAALQGWCDPLDAACRRILTILLAEEY